MLVMRCFACALLMSLGVFGCANSPQTLPGTAAENAIPKSKIETGIKLARIQERQGHLHKALRMYEDMHMADPSNAEVCHRLVVVCTRMDQPAKADAFFQRAYQLRPDNAELLADYGYVCCLRGDLTAAEGWLKKAQLLQPGDERTLGNLAMVVAAQGRLEESLAYYRQYLDDADANANLGFILAQRGDFAAARERYTKALSLNPNLKPAQHALLQLAEHPQSAKKSSPPATARLIKPAPQPYR